MSIRETGEFTLGLKSIELQLQTLLENAGGGKATKLLDSLCKLGSTEQELVLAIFSKVIKNIVAGDIRLDELGYSQLNEFEEGLYKEIIAEIEKNSISKSKERKRGINRFSVLKGGSKNIRKKGSHLSEVVSIEVLKNKKNEKEDILH